MYTWTSVWLATTNEFRVGSIWMHISGLHIPILSHSTTSLCSYLIFFPLPEISKTRHHHHQASAFGRIIIIIVIIIIRADTRT